MELRVSPHNEENSEVSQQLFSYLIILDTQALNMLPRRPVFPSIYSFQKAIKKGRNGRVYWKGVEGEEAYLQTGRQ